MCKTPKGVSQHVRQSGARTCGHRGFGARAWWGAWDAHGHGSLWHTITEWSATRTKGSVSGRCRPTVCYNPQYGKQETGSARFSQEETYFREIVRQVGTRAEVM